MADNSVCGYYLTARCTEQLCTEKTGNGTKPAAQAEDQSAVPNYTSTESQTAVVDKNYNAAITYSALASFGFGRNSAVNLLNSYNKTTERNAKLEAGKYAS